MSLQTNRTIAAENYARNCYGRDVSFGDILDCNFYPRRFLNYSTGPAPCPFKHSELCITQGHEAFAMESGNFTLSEIVCSPIDSRPFIYDKQASFREAILRQDIPVEAVSADPNGNPQDYWFYLLWSTSCILIEIGAYGLQFQPLKPRHSMTMLQATPGMDHMSTTYLRRMKWRRCSCSSLCAGASSHFVSRPTILSSPHTRLRTSRNST